MIKHFYLLIVLTFSGNNLAEENLRLAAASSFRPALEKLVPLFEQENAVKVQWRATSSGSLYTQITQGAPYDLFLSADSHFPKKLAEAGFADGSTRITYALGILAWWQPEAKSASLAKPAQFQQPIALAKSKLAPYGRAAEQVIEYLEKNGSVFSKKVYGANISQTFQFIASGNAVGGFVAYSYLKSANIQSSYWIIPTIWYQPIEQQAIVISNDNHCTSKKFLSFLQSEAAQKIILNTGYSLPPSFNMLSKPSFKGCVY